MDAKMSVQERLALLQRLFGIAPTDMSPAAIAAAMGAYVSNSLVPQPAQVIPFVNPVVVNLPLALTTATGSGQLDIRFARSGHVPGSVLGLLVPGGRFAVLLIGTNVYRVGGTSATVLSTYQSCMATLRGIGFHVVVTTCPPSSLISGANETARLTGNAALFGIGADGVIDLASDSVCGNVANYSNGVLGTDGTHALEAGCVQWGARRGARYQRGARGMTPAASTRSTRRGESRRLRRPRTYSTRAAGSTEDGRTRTRSACAPASSTRPAASSGCR